MSSINKHLLLNIPDNLKLWSIIYTYCFMTWLHAFRKFTTYEHITDDTKLS